MFVRAPALVTIGALVVAACTGPAETTAPETARVDVETIRRARAELGPAAADLGEAGQAVQRAVAALRLGVPADPADRAAAVEPARSLVGALDRALDAASAATAPSEARDVARAWEQALIAAGVLADVARTDLDFVAELAAVDQELASLVGRWQEPGARSQQLERLADIGETATGLAGRLGQMTERPPCGTATARRVAAADHVASASGELRDLVAGFRGDEFDRRRDELAADPYGLGQPHIGATDARDRPCWQDQGASEQAATVLLGALGRLEEALNPPAVVSPGG